MLNDTQACKLIDNGEIFETVILLKKHLKSVLEDEPVWLLLAECADNKK